MYILESNRSYEESLRDSVNMNGKQWAATGEQAEVWIPRPG